MFVLYYSLFNMQWQYASSKNQSTYLNLKILYYWDVPGIPVVKTHAPNAEGPGSIPGWELDPTCCSHGIK